MATSSMLAAGSQANVLAPLRAVNSIRAAPFAFKATCPGRQSLGFSGASQSVAHGLSQPFLRQRVLVARAEPQRDPSSTSPAQEGQDITQTLVSVGLAALWLGLGVYALGFSPNQTPYRDQIFIERLVGLGEKDGFVINQVFVALFNVMGIYPGIYAALLVPGGRSENKVPAWPFVAVSFFLGVFALLPYMALWRPKRDNKLPPAPEELEGWNRLYMKGAETPVLPALLLAGALYCTYLAATAGGDVWLDYLKLFDESRFIHVTTLDFCTLTALAPFWMDVDATARNWDKRSQLLPILSLIPVIGPATYLLLRPKTQQPTK